MYLNGSLLHAFCIKKTITFPFCNLWLCLYYKRSQNILLFEPRDNVNMAQTVLATVCREWSLLLIGTYDSAKCSKGCLRTIFPTYWNAFHTRPLGNIFGWSKFGDNVPRLYMQVLILFYPFHSRRFWSLTVPLPCWQMKTQDLEPW